MIYFKHILFLVISSFIFCFSINDSLLVLKDSVEKKAILIPEYINDNSKFKFDYLGKNRKIFYDSNISYIDDYESANITFSPYINNKNFRFKIDFEYFYPLKDSSLLTNDWSPIGILEKIDYLELSLFNEKINLFLGEISDLSFGFGYLLNKYGNNYNYPVDRNVGFKLRLKNSNNSVLYNFFVSNIDELFNSGSLIGNHISFLKSDALPLRIGFGHIVDQTQLINYKDSIDQDNRRINAFEIDFDMPLFNILNKNVLLIGEFSAIKLPDTRYYKRADDSQFTNDKKFRDGLWGWMFPGLKYAINDYSMMLAFNYNSSIFSPYYFNSTYDFERVRYRLYDIINNEENFSNESEELIKFSSDSVSVFIPKDLYSMINGYENTYPTYGFSASIDRMLDDNNYLSIQYSHLKEITDNDTNLSFNSLWFNFCMSESLLSFPYQLHLFLSKTFFESSNLNSLDENLMYGLSLNLNIYKKIFFLTEFRNTYYDQNIDGRIDRISYINTGLKIKF